MRRLLAALGVLLFVAAPGAFVRVEAQEAQVVAEKDGWWNRLPAPLAPLTGATFPEDALAVSSSGPQVTKLAAIGFTLDVPAGAEISELLMVLQESSERGTSANQANAKLNACPATTLWGKARNGDWEQRPDQDCALAKSVGERSPTGSWVFDLTSMAELWVSGSDPYEQNGVVIVPDVETGPPTTQVAFGDISTGSVFLSLEVDLPPALPEPSEEPAQPETFTEEIFEPFEPSFEPETVEIPEPEEPPTAILETERAVTQAERITDPNLFGNLPWVVFVLIPLAIGTALFISYVLGPAGEPAAARRRSGAVSRALENRTSEA